MLRRTISVAASCGGVFRGLALIPLQVYWHQTGKGEEERQGSLLFAVSEAA